MTDRTIWKYPIDLNFPITTLSVPYHSQVLCVQTQGEEAKVWMLVNPIMERKTDIRFYVYPTGHGVYNFDRKEYIGTVQVGISPFITVWHIFMEVTPWVTKE